MSSKGYKPNIDCRICKKRVPTSVWKMHVMGKKHLHYTPTKITVSGTFDSNRVNEAHSYFGQFGTIGTKKFTERDGKIAIDYIFQDRRAHSKIIYKEHNLFNQELRVTWEEVTTPLPYPPNPVMNLRNQKNKADAKPVPGRRALYKKSDAENSKQALINSLKEAQSFTDQVLLLQSKLQIDKLENEKKKKQIHDDLTAALAPMFALNKIYFFGSSVTGLDVKGSDLDVYIANVREENRPEVQTLKIVRHLIFKCRKFCDVLLISGAKIPIIKCIHTKTQICCDLNIKNKLSVCNSQLIRYYLSLDDKMRPLMVMIKFWADLYDLKKVNFFSSYALYMMVIFYMQHEPYNIPAVKDLQTDIAPNLVEGWNCAFELKGFANPALKNESLMNLAAGFFRFYSKFDYISKVITPFVGTGVDKTCFVKPYKLPSCYLQPSTHKEALAVGSGICIQDPFEHSRNVAASVPLQCIGRFVLMCRNSLKIMQEGESDVHKVLTQKLPTDYKIEIDKPDDKDEDEWKRCVKDLICKILTGIMNMKMVQTRTETPLSYTCRSDHDIFDGRINILKNLTDLPAGTRDIDKEIAATKCIVKYLHQTLPVGLSLEIDFKENPCRVAITLSPLNKKCKTFLHACHFFHVRLDKYLVPERPEDVVAMEVDADRTASVRTPEPPFEVMTQKSHKSDKNKVGDASSGKQVSGGDETNENRTDGGETSKSGEEKALFEDEEEDVPADFFDDFSNQDFMDGLDIVDAWDEDKLVDSESDNQRSPDKRRRPHSPIRFMSKSPERRSRKFVRSRSKSLTRRYSDRSNSHTKKRSRSRSRDKTRMSERRDPEKTKRDINKDKIKCAKDREQKIVNDKLRIVETGLVPPGMEMEADINSILGKEKEKQRSDTASNMEKMREPQPSRDRDRERERERRYPRKSTSREMRKLVRYSPSPPPTYRNRPREREPLHRFHKRTSSIDSNLSERELWIRSTRKRSRSRSRDSAHRRAKTKKYEEKKKKSFLEEIRDKLNETRTPLPPVVPASTYGMQPYPGAAAHSIPGPAPAPVPAPSPYFPPAPNLNSPMQQYDQSFFIGDSYQNVSQAQPMLFNVPGSAGNVMQMHPGPVQHVPPVQAVKVPPAPVIKPQALVLPKVNILSDVTVKARTAEKKKQAQERTEDIDKLFADKKISLSDFLTITAKCEVQSSSPEHLQKKIKVISRCQDAVKAMSDDRKFNGRLSVKPSFDQKNKAESKYQSPLRRIPVVRFQFTSPMKISEELDGFGVALDKILLKIGVLKETVDLERTAENVTNLSNSSFADEETAALTLKASILHAKKVEAKSECEECKKRRMKSYSEVGSQCVDSNETVSIATQVTEEDLISAKGPPKNDSIAYLTPAQLLGKEKEKEKEAEAGPPTTPEKVQVPEKNLESPAPLMKMKPKGPAFKARGAFRKNQTLRDRKANNYYEYDNEEFYDGGQQMYEAPRENFGRRYGGPSGPRPPPPGRFQRQYMEKEEMPQMHPHRLHQFVEEEGNFNDFGQPFRGGRGGRFPRY